MPSISTLVDRVKIFVLSSGTGPFQLGSAVPAYRGVEALADGGTYSYAVESGSTYEAGTFSYVSSTNTAVRTPMLSSNGGAAVAFPAGVQLVLTALAQDLVATGGAFPIIDSLGSGTAVAPSQRAVTEPIVALQEDVSLRVPTDTLAAASGAGLVGSDDGAAGSLWSTVSGFISYLRSSAGSAVIGFMQAGSGAVARFVRDKLRETVSVKDFGAVGDGVTDDTVAINLAIAYVGTNGGGSVYLPAGVYLVSNSNPSAVSWDNRRAIYVPYSNVQLIGAGRKATKILLADGANAHIIAVGNRGTSGEPVITCSYVRVADMEIDGNRLNQSLPTELADKWVGIYVVNAETSGLTCTGVVVERIWAHDIQYYAVGFQRNAFVGCVIRDVISERTGADGIDCKGDDDTASSGNIIESVVVRQWGLAPGVANQAGIDLRQGWTGSGLDVADPGVTGLVGIRIQNGVPGSTPRAPTRISGFSCIGNSGPVGVGVRVISLWATVSEGICRNFVDGVSVTDSDCRISSVVAANCSGAGFRFWQNGVTAGEADTAALVGLVSRNNGTGVVVDSCDEITFLGCDIRSNANGYDIRTGSSGIRIIGGSCVGNTTRLINNGASTIVRNVSGLRTESKPTTTFAIGSTGIKTITLAHGLAVTPNKGDVILSVEESTAVDDAIWSSMKVVSADATNVVGKINVTTASANGAATAIMRAHCNALSA